MQNMIQNIYNRHKKKVVVSVTIIYFFIMFFLLGGMSIFRDLVHVNSPVPLAATATSVPLPALPNGLGDIPFPNGQYVGINDGSFPAFDVYPGRVGSAAKANAAQALKKGDDQTAMATLDSGILQDPTDEEARIYRENINAVEFGNFITLVVPLDFVKAPDTVSQRTLRGVYIAQYEFNHGNHGVKLRILIANTGNNLDYVAPVTRQIVQIAKQEHIIAVMGWPTSRSTLNAMPILAIAKIPVVSQSASSDDLTNNSPYFFRIIGPNVRQAQAAAAFVHQGLNAKNAVVFFDPLDTYSSTIAKDFEGDFTDDGGVILAGSDHAYTKGGNAVGFYFTTSQTTKEAFSQLIQQALRQHPDVDVFYYAGVTAHDAILFQDALPPKTSSTVPTVAGDGAYTAEPNSYGRWYFAAYAYPDAWPVIIKDHMSTPLFFTDYETTFDPTGKHTGDYNFGRANSDALLAYDATDALMQAVIQIGTGSITPQAVTANLPRVAFQGVSGYISFGLDGNPPNKPVLILAVDKDGHLQMNCVALGVFSPNVDQSQLNCHP
jgi:ABC-type branched-subunit amino acid transport system substrate-binding protein